MYALCASVSGRVSRDGERSDLMSATRVMIVLAAPFNERRLSGFDYQGRDSRRQNIDGAIAEVRGSARSTVQSSSGSSC